VAEVVEAAASEPGSVEEGAEAAGEVGRVEGPYGRCGEDARPLSPGGCGLSLLVVARLCPLREWRQGDALNTATDHHSYVIAAGPTPGSANRWNLNVQQLHTYYVPAGSTPVLVHNAGCWRASEDELDDIYDTYGPAVAQGVECNVARYNQGASNKILVIRTPQDVHAYNFTEQQWKNAVGTKYVEP
jgi:hypothetical protein